MMNMDSISKEQLAKAIFSYCTGCWGGKQPERVLGCDNIYCKLHGFRLLAAPEFPEAQLKMSNTSEPKKKKISEEDQKILANKKKAIPKK